MPSLKDLTNIMVQNDELILIDMDEIMRGHPIYDIADIYYAYQDLHNMGRSERYLNMNEEMCKRFIDTFTKKYFAGYDENTLERLMKGVKAFAKLRGVHAVLLCWQQITAGLRIRKSDLHS